MSITFANDVEAEAMSGPDGAQIEFAAGLPGLPAARRFALEDFEDDLQPFRRLRSVGEPAITFTVVDPALVFPGYTVEIEEDQQDSLEIRSADDAIVLVMITVPRPPLPPTANLLGPIIVNRVTGAAAQVVQHRSSYKVAEPLPGWSDQ